MVQDRRKTPWGSILTASLAILGFAAAWGKANADVNTLQKDVNELKPLASAVAVINNEIPNIKESVQEVREYQKNMQGDINQIQRDIKTLLFRERNRENHE